MKSLISKAGRNKFRNALSVLALLAVVLVNTGDVHVRLCFDGQKPAVTSHFELLSGVTDHYEESDDDIDPEYEVSLELLKIKSLVIAKVYLATPTFVLPENAFLVSKSLNSYPGEFLPQEPEYISLPLRAPPVLIG